MSSGQVCRCKRVMGKKKSKNGKKISCLSTSGTSSAPTAPEDFGKCDCGICASLDYDLPKGVEMVLELSKRNQLILKAQLVRTWLRHFELKRSMSALREAVKLDPHGPDREKQNDQANFIRSRLQEAKAEYTDLREKLTHSQKIDQELKAAREKYEFLNKDLSDIITNQKSKA